MYLKSNKINGGSCLRIRIISFNYCSYYTAPTYFLLYGLFNITWNVRTNYTTGKLYVVSNVPPIPVVEHLYKKFYLIFGVFINFIIIYVEEEFLFQIRNEIYDFLKDEMWRKLFCKLTKCLQQSISEVKTNIREQVCSLGSVENWIFQKWLRSRLWAIFEIFYSFFLFYSY